MTRYVDLSHPVHDGTVTYPGLPAPTITTFISREESAQRLASGASFHIGRLDMVANTGTYLDAPFHFYGDGVDVAGLPLNRLVDVPVVVIDARAPDGDDIAAAGGAAVGAAAVEAAGDDLTGAAVLVLTGWSRHWGTPEYLTGGPHLAADAVAALVAREPALVGIDALNIDAIADTSRPAHRGLLGAGIPILEHLTNLDSLPARGARLFAVPPPFVGMGTFPVRAVAAID